MLALFGFTVSRYFFRLISSTRPPFRLIDPKSDGVSIATRAFDASTASRGSGAGSAPAGADAAGIVWRHHHQWPAI